MGLAIFSFPLPAAPRFQRSQSELSGAPLMQQGEHWGIAAQPATGAVKSAPETLEPVADLGVSPLEQSTLRLTSAGAAVPGTTGDEWSESETAGTNTRWWPWQLQSPWG